MMVQRFKLLLIVFSLMLFACASNQSTEQSNKSENTVPPPNKAISMHGSKKITKAYNLYGISIGENKASVEDKYKMVLCRKGVYFLRCLIYLDTRDVTGLSSSDTATIFITFKDNVVHGMTIPVAAVSLKEMRETLIMFYGEPDSMSEDKTSWSNDSGSVVLEKSGYAMQPFSVGYASNE